MAVDGSADGVLRGGRRGARSAAGPMPAGAPAAAWGREEARRSTQSSCARSVAQDCACRPVQVSSPGKHEHLLAGLMPHNLQVRPIRNDTSVDEFDDAVATSGETGVMGDDQE